ncbi:MAG TPA: DUF3332 family protein [Nitrospiraceae bacterium]|nr:DUF3332 family protein [Nitrospiraceae bacterium]
MSLWQLAQPQRDPSPIGSAARAPVADHSKVLHLINAHRLYGQGLGWIDAHLLASALLTGCELWTSDRPLHALSALLDAFIFNSIQFWSGSNPVKADDAGGNRTTRVVQLGGVTVTMFERDRGATVTYEWNGIVERRATIETNATGYRLIDETGALLAEAEKDWMGASRSSIATAKWLDNGPPINCWHWRERPSTERNLGGSTLIGDRMDGQIRKQHLAMRRQSGARGLGQYLQEDRSLEDQKRTPPVFASGLPLWECL